MHAHTWLIGYVFVCLSAFFLPCDCRLSCLVAVVIDDVPSVYHSGPFLLELAARLCCLGHCSRRTLTLSSEPPRPCMLPWWTACLELRTGLPSRRGQRRTSRSGAPYPRARPVCVRILVHRACSHLHLLLQGKQARVLLQRRLVTTGSHSSTGSEVCCPMTHQRQPWLLSGS